MAKAKITPGAGSFNLEAIYAHAAKVRGEPWPPSSCTSWSGSRPTPARSMIYFVGPAGGPIKIGRASRLEFRLRDLRLANAFPLELWASIEAPTSLEREYHARFDAHRLHGEWFERCPEIEAEIARLNTQPLAGPRALTTTEINQGE